MSLLVMLTGVVVLVLNAIVIGRIVQLVGDGALLATVAAVSLVAFHYALIFWTLRGMDVGFLALLIDTSILLYLRLVRRFSWKTALALAVVLGLSLLVRMDALVAAVLGLDPPFRDVILLRYYRGLPLAEIALRSGAPLETVRTRLKRAHQLLRGKLDRDYGNRASWCLASRRVEPAAQARRRFNRGRLVDDFRRSDHELEVRRGRGRRPGGGDGDHLESG